MNRSWSFWLLGRQRRRLLLFVGRHLRRDNLVSVLYAEELNSTKSSVFLQRTDRHGILDQKSADFQCFLSQHQAEHPSSGPADRALQEQCALFQTGDGTPRYPPGVLVVGNGSRPLLAHPPGGGDALYLRPQARRWSRNAQRVLRSSAPGDAGGLFAQRLARGDARVGARDPGDGNGLGTRWGRRWRGRPHHRGGGRNLLGAYDAGVHGPGEWLPVV